MNITVRTNVIYPLRTLGCSKKKYFFALDVFLKFYIIIRSCAKFERAPVTGTRFWSRLKFHVHSGHSASAMLESSVLRDPDVHIGEYCLALT
jgi:hypothetical protein